MGENDLPLLSNINDIRARHYLIQLQTDVLSRTISGTVIIFFDVTSPCELKGEFCCEKCSCTEISDSGYKVYVKNDKSLFPITLECNNLNIKSVAEIQANSKEEVKLYLSPKHLRNNREDFKYWNDKTKENLTYSQDKWSIKIRGKELFHSSEFPKVICITYVTHQEGGSLYWRKCDGGEVCFFTAGSFINNRSLLPSQDRPLAMATWQAWVTVPKDFYVSMTGDKEPLILHSNNTIGRKEQTRCHYYYTSMVLPVATIAIAAGKWKVEDIISEDDVLVFNKSINTVPTLKQSILIDKCNHVIYPCHTKTSCTEPLIPVNLVTTTALHPKASVLMKFIKFILIASHKLLGRYPFTRLEIVILPRCFPNLGFASPNVIYLSKSILLDDSSLYVRLAHEISHSWFGITVGPKNWEEEWLSEGFATYLEDSIYTLAIEECLKAGGDMETGSDLKKIALKYDDLFYLRGHIRYKILLNERENCSEELQILSPNNLCSNYEEGSVNNGLNPNKSFLQIHYLKGYFLLHFLSNFVSRYSFDKFLRLVALKFHGQLITSDDFLNVFYEYFPYMEAVISKSKIIKDWLKNADINGEIVKSFGTISTNNPLLKTINKHHSYWLTFNKSYKKNNFKLNESKIYLLTEHKFRYSDQIVLLLENFLDCDKLKVDTLREIYSFYKIQNRNCDIQHRWCELIIKHNFPDTADIAKFLIENQAMGVYLYGELIISGRKHHRKLAEELFSMLENELGTNSKDVISSMIFGN